VQALQAAGITVQAPAPVAIVDPLTGVHAMHYADDAVRAVQQIWVAWQGTLREAGFALACVTNKTERFTLPLLDKTGLAPFFELVVSGDTCARKKPHPDMLLHACEHFGVAPAEALMVGDSSNDVEAARAAGCPVWCLPYGYNEGGPGVPLAADRVIDSFMELPTLLTLAGRDTVLEAGAA
jgi:HAD superfamily hydrolase (TIGR01509 family)